MSTKRTCVTPEDGWGLVHHFLGNLLNTIPFNYSREKEEMDEEKKYKYTRIIDDVWALLVGNLYIIMRRMKLHGHDDVGEKMQQLLNMLIELNLADPEACELIHKKEAELNPIINQFQAAVAKLRAEHGK